VPHAKSQQKLSRQLDPLSAGLTSSVTIPGDAGRSGLQLGHPGWQQPTPAVPPEHSTARHTNTLNLESHPHTMQAHTPPTMPEGLSSRRADGASPQTSLNQGKMSVRTVETRESRNTYLSRPGHCTVIGAATTTAANNADLATCKLLLHTAATC
jgi:hypothetical protein